jgi:hypothetical protein
MDGRAVRELHMKFRRRPFSLIGLIIVGMLFLAVMVVWIRGWWVSDVITGFDRVSSNRMSSERLWSLESWNGVFRVRRTFTVYDGRYSRTPFLDGHWHGWRWKTTPVVDPSVSAEWGGWRLEYDSQIKQGNSERSVQVSYWIIEAVLLFPGVLLYLRFRGRRKYPEGFCPEYGYDIRATPDRCPECGTIPKLAAVT